MPDLWSSLTNGFMPHGYCLRWDQPLVITFIVGNLGIALAYFMIPLALRHFVGRRKDLPYPHMFKLFALFILSCGMTHIAKIWTLYQPAYWFEAGLDLWTAGVSLITAVLLVPIIPQALKLRSPSELDEANRQLRDLNAELEKSKEDLKRTVSHLQVALDDALVASRVKSQFVSTISHEVRTPLSAVMGLAEVLSVEESLDDDNRMVAVGIFDASKRLLAILNDVLDLSKVESGKMTIEYLPLSLANLASDVIANHSADASKKELSLTCDIDTSLPETVCGDELRLRQVIQNLVSNAIKFTDAGSVTLKVGHISQDESTTTVKFSVIDTGIGIGDESRAQIFEAYMQADNSITRRFGGTGLGLSIAKNYVELMGGEIGVDSVLNKGSEFWFTVPFPAGENSPCKK